jgi:hypothetical protein
MATRRSAVSRIEDIPDADPGNESLDNHPLAERGRTVARPPQAAGSLDWRQAVGGALIGLGIIATVVAWYGVSGTVDPGEQMPYISSGGFGGAALIALGVTLLVGYEHARDRGALLEVLDELDAVRGRLDDLAHELRDTTSAASSRPAGARNGTRGTTARTRRPSPS